MRLGPAEAVKNGQILLRTIPRTELTGNGIERQQDDRRLEQLRLA